MANIGLGNIFVFGTVSRQLDGAEKISTVTNNFVFSDLLDRQTSTRTSGAKVGVQNQALQAQRNFNGSRLPLGKKLEQDAVSYGNSHNVSEKYSYNEKYQPTVGFEFSKVQQEFNATQFANSTTGNLFENNVQLTDGSVSISLSDPQNGDGTTTVERRSEPTKSFMLRWATGILAYTDVHPGRTVSEPISISTVLYRQFAPVVKNLLIKSDTSINSRSSNFNDNTDINVGGNNLGGATKKTFQMEDVNYPTRMLENPYSSENYQLKQVIVFLLDGKGKVYIGDPQSTEPYRVADAIVDLGKSSGVTIVEVRINGEIVYDNKSIIRGNR